MKPVSKAEKYRREEAIKGIKQRTEAKSQRSKEKDRSKKPTFKRERQKQKKLGFSSIIMKP